MTKLTKKERTELAEKAFFILVQKCFAKNKILTDFIGRTIRIPLSDGCAFSFKISPQFALAFDELMNKAVKEYKKHVLEGDGNTRPTGIINATGKKSPGPKPRAN